ncbi:uncharacterized WD repeat-containing protein C1306.02-like [Pollicipes pollicipes]|uniref:uncharacterized WD repeat-containing protein C1306.02-like n=1 Tax=Pollicipes pollicipes TaxID=41117 RepID=UPI001885473A|nr:uncharacterized WD repeat-containing protein C1306.02-like [Pollicipes pollicipes]
MGHVAAERELWRVTCGGGHRSWALSVSSDALWLSWVSERQVRHVSCLLADLQTSVIKPGLQSGATLSALHLGRAPDGGALLATAGEDTTVRLLSAAPGRPLRPLVTLRAHISSVRALLFAFSDAAPRLTPLRQLSLGGQCVLRLRWSGRLLMAATTSGVNALSVRPAPGGAVQLLTGGDDGALCLSQLRTNGARPRLETAARQTGAHTSQITAVLWLPDGRLLSVSVDQRVCVWSERAGRLRLDSTRLTAVADAKGALLWTEDGTVMVLVYGEGLELLRLDLRSLSSPECQPRADD